MTRHGAMYHDKLSYALPTIVAGTLITAWKKKETRCFAKNDEFKKSHHNYRFATRVHIIQQDEDSHHHMIVLKNKTLVAFINFRLLQCVKAKLTAPTVCKGRSILPSHTVFLRWLSFLCKFLQPQPIFYVCDAIDIGVNDIMYWYVNSI